MSTQAHPLTDLGFKPEAATHPLSDLGFQPEQQTATYNFGKSVAGGMGLDTGKIERMETDPAGHKHMVMGALEAIKQLMQGTGKWMDATIRDPFHIADPIQSVASSVTSAAGLPDKGSAFDLSGYHRLDPGALLGATSMVAAGAERGGPIKDLAALPNKALDVASKAGEFGKTTVKEAMGAGPSTERLGADRIAHAQAVKEHISNVEDAVHEKAKAGAAGIDSAVDEANPKGFFDKSGMRMGVRDALGEISKIPEKWPSSVSKLLAEDKVTRTTGPSVGGRTMDLSNPNDLAAYKRYKEAGVFSPEEIQRMEGSEKTPNWTMGQMRQLRSEVGRDLGRYENKGAIGAALNNVYGYLTGEMRKAATTVGMEADFLKNNAEYKQWMDDFHRSPLKKVLNGQTSGTIIKALSDERSQGLIDKYQDYGMDSQALKEEAKRAAISGTVSRFSRPSKWDLIVAAYAPHVAAIRLLAPYLMRNPKLLDALGGKGLPVEEGVKNIKPAQVYINKKAAALAARNR